MFFKVQKWKIIKNTLLKYDFGLKKPKVLFLGIGKIWLLENIRKTGSITNAAKEMKMAYRQAWQLVEEMNQRAESPLVEKLFGRKGGGGARLTPAAEKAKTVFYEI